jgi:hypothetical protein
LEKPQNTEFLIRAGIVLWAAGRGRADRARPDGANDVFYEPSYNTQGGGERELKQDLRQPTSGVSPPTKMKKETRTRKKKKERKKGRKMKQGWKQRSTYERKKEERKKKAQGRKGNRQPAS